MTRGHKADPDPILEAMRLASADERLAAEFMEKRRWGDCPACPRCGSVDVYQMRDAKTGARNKDLRWRCRDCAKLNKDRKKQKQPTLPEMFTVRTGTTFEESRLPMRVWVFAFWSACSSKKGVSALQIARECGINYKSALFVMHRVRRAMATDGPRPKLGGTIEADETYVGGKPRHKGPWNPRGWVGKAPVVGVVQRDGEVRYWHLERVTANTVASALRANVDKSARLMTDESRAYSAVGREFEGGHETVSHTKKEYARGDAHSNTIEGAFSLLKRGVYGTFHSVSKKHLHRYLAEFEFRYNARKMGDGARVELAIKGAYGKRLTYKQQVAG